MKNWIKQLKAFLPFLGLSGLFFLFILLTVLLFNYYASESPALINKINPYLLLVRWDSFHYLSIAIGENHTLVFFPLYPWLIRLFSLFFSPIFSGFLISFLSLSTALYFLYKIVRDNYGQEISRRVLVLLLLFPSSIFFSLIYTESLFLAFLTAFFYLAGKKRWLAAAIVGFFASLTRNIGIFLWPIFIIYLFTDIPAVIQSKKNIIVSFLTHLPKLIKKRALWYSILIPLGLILYCLYTYIISGDFFAFINGQEAWSDVHVFMWPWSTMSHIVKYYLLTPISETGMYNFLRIIVFEGGSFLLVLAATIYWIIKKHWPYAAFCLLNVLLFSCMYPMTSANRYAAVVFPVFIFLAALTRKRDWLFYSIMIVFSLFLIFNTLLISNGSWIG